MMLKTIGITKSITQTKSELSKIIKEVNELREPAFILNHNTPEAVILSIRDYTEMVEKYNEMEEKLFYSNLLNRVETGPIEKLSTDQVIENNEDKNPFAHLSEEELFD